MDRNMEEVFRRMKMIRNEGIHQYQMFQRHIERINCDYDGKDAAVGATRRPEGRTKTDIEKEDMRMVCVSEEDAEKKMHP